MMETKFNFNSAICTSKEQSERLLALGLKKETADMYWWQETDQYGDGNGKWHRQLLDLKEDKRHFKYLDKTFGICLEGNTDEGFFIPAWSLHRLIEMMPKDVEAEITLTNGRIRTEWLSFVMNYACNIIYIDEQQEEFKGFYEGNIYNKVVDAYEWLIKEGYFNKEYLV